MPEFLVGIVYHEPEAFALWNRGAVEDYESSTGLYVEADSPSEALAWAARVGEALLRHVNNDPSLDWKAFGYDSWLEDAPAASGWGHCLDFFPHVRAGQMPDLDRMTTAAYRRWLEGRAGG